MKRVIAIVLTLAIALGLCACGGSGSGVGESSSADLQVGYGRESILPKDSIGVPGYANEETRRSSGYSDILYTTCLAFSDGTDTVLVYSADILYMAGWCAEKIRTQVSQETGVPKDKIMISATHTHSGPAYYEQPYFDDLFIPACVKAAEKAIADMAPTTMYGAKTETDNLNFVRHYIDKNGEYVGNGISADQAASHARESDPEMIVIKLDREGDKKDISMVNWQNHPCFAYEKDTLLSADFIAGTRTEMEAKTGTHFIYFTGAAGDLGTGSKVSTEKAPYSNAMEYGVLIAEKAIEAWNGTMKEIEGSGIKINQAQFEYATNRFGIERVEDAQKVVDYAEKIGSYESKISNDYAKEMGFASARQCLTITHNAKKPEKAPMELNVLYVGGMAFAFAPYEMFAENGVFIKKNSPFEFTFINELSNDYFHYFPVKAAYEAVDIYEAVTADFASGVAEATADQFVSMLQQLQ